MVVGFINNSLRLATANHLDLSEKCSAFRSKVREKSWSAKRWFLFRRQYHVSLVQGGPGRPSRILSLVRNWNPAGDGLGCCSRKVVVIEPTSLTAYGLAAVTSDLLCVPVTVIAARLRLGEANLKIRPLEIFLTMRTAAGSSKRRSSNNHCGTTVRKQHPRSHHIILVHDQPERWRQQHAVR